MALLGAGPSCVAASAVQQDRPRWTKGHGTRDGAGRTVAARAPARSLARSAAASFTRLRPSDDEPERLCPEVRGQTVTPLYLSPSEDAPSPCPWEGRQLPGTPGFSRKADRLRCRAS